MSDDTGPAQAEPTAAGLAAEFPAWQITRGAGGWWKATATFGHICACCQEPIERFGLGYAHTGTWLRACASPATTTAAPLGKVDVYGEDLTDLRDMIRGFLGRAGLS